MVIQTRAKEKNPGYMMKIRIFFLCLSSLGRTLRVVAEFVNISQVGVSSTVMMKKVTTWHHIISSFVNISQVGVLSTVMMKKVTIWHHIISSLGKS